MTETKKNQYIGLWENVDKNGQPYLGGKDKETGIKYFVFKDAKDPKISKLCTAVEGEDIKTIGTLDKKSNDFGEFMICEGYIVATNRYYEEGTTKPQFQVKLPTK